MKKYFVIFGIILLALVLIQCSKRDNPVDTESQSGSYWTLFFESNAIRGDRLQDYWFRNIMVYTPPGYDPGDTLRPVATGIDHIDPAETTIYTHQEGDSIVVDSVHTFPPETVFVYGDTALGVYYPVLYLLHGYGGNHNYFRGLYDLADLMDELINSNQIDPMIVVTPNATNKLGGSFYTNSPDFGSGQSYAGRMQDFITDEVIHVIDSVFNTQPDRQHRGVAGHSMGGYGAVKLAILRNDLFASAASMSGPLTFWGSYPTDSSFAGIFALIPAVFQENGFTPGDTAAFYRITPSPQKRLTSMMFAMASAFSPHDPANTDTSYAHYFDADPGTEHVDLPFDVNGQLAPSIWNLWMTNDVAAIFNVMYGVFDSTALYVDCGNQDDLYLHIHAQIFNQLALSKGVTDIVYRPYSGFEDFYAADHTTLIAERIKEVAKFHNAAFNQ
jgi:pimeloyl-ACP methyl ester carboxylesterase